MIRKCAVTISLITRTGLDFLLGLPLDELYKIAETVANRGKAGNGKLKGV